MTLPLPKRDRRGLWSLRTIGTVAAVVTGAGLLGACGPNESSPTPATGTLPTTTSVAGTSAAGPAAAATGSETPSTAAAPAAQDQAGHSVAAALGLLPIKGRAPKTGYSRAQFGQAWADVDRNGCDTRNDVLTRDLTATTYKPGTGGCLVLTGDLHDPYSGRVIAFTRGETTSSTIQIDHVVALSDAWQTGAQQLDLERRTAFANDPLNLLAADGPLNMQKSDSDAASWLPPNKSFRCAYVARQVAVKSTYGLWVTQAEHDAIATVLQTCPGQQLPAPGSTPTTPAPTTPATTNPAPAMPAPTIAPTAVAGASYANCAAARAAGAAPVHRGEPGYSSKLDRDGDGVGCE